MKRVNSGIITDNIVLHTLKEDKFKTNLINIYFRRPLIKEEVTYNALLPMVLQRGTKLCKSSKDLSKKLEGLYGAYLSGDVAKKGENQIIRFSLSIADDSYIEKSNILQEGLKLMRDVLTDPLLENEAFKEEYVKQEKENLKNRIKGRINDKMKYAIDRCGEIMCADENYSLYEYGNIEDLENMGSKNLYTHYKKVMSTSPIDIIAVGNLEHDGLKDVIKNIFQLKVDQVEIVENEFKKVTPTQIKEVKEKMDISQGKLTLGYRTNLPYDDPLYPALMVYSSILGGGAHSKLFLKVREEKSLCYYIFSRIDRFKSLMFISSGIETNKFQIAKDVIMDQLLEMEKGNITDQEMEYAKKTLINSIKSLKDSGDTMAEYLYSQIFAKRIESLEKVIQEIEGVTVDQIIEVAKKINLDTVYFLTNEEV